MALLDHLHTHTSRRPSMEQDGDPIVLARGPSGRPLPAPGSLVFIEFPTAVAGEDAALIYTVVDIDGRGNLTADAIVGDAPALPAETPCLVRYRGGLDELTVDALTLTSSDRSVIVRLNTAEARRYPRCRHELDVSIELPGTRFPVALGTTEDVSLGGLRARLPMPVPPTRHVFVTVHPRGTPPIVAVARIVSCDALGLGAGYAVRIEYTLMAPIDQARLWSLVESATDEIEL
jgi:hypothetical protein